MNVAALAALRRELVSRGFDQDLRAPNGTMVLDADYLQQVELAELLDTLVARREKIFGSASVVGEDTAKEGYSDVVRAIEATKAVIGLLLMPVSH